MKYVFRRKRNIFLALVTDAVLFILWRPWNRRKPFSGPCKTILLVRLDHLGDVLYSTAAPKLLKNQFPQARLVCLTSSYSAPLFEQNPFVDETLIYDASWFARNRFPRSKQSLGFWGLLRHLRRRRIDLGIGLRGDLRENVMMALAGVRERVGYGITGGGALLTQEVRYRPGVHMSEHTLDLLRVVGVEAARLEPKLYFSAEEGPRLDTALREWGVDASRSLIGFQIEAGYRSKEWPIESMSRFLSVFTSEVPSHTVVLIGSDTQKARLLRQMMAGGAERVADLTGRTSIRQLCLLLGRMKVFIGHDSGPSYIAGTLGVPTVFLYSGTNVFDEWKPLVDNVTVIRKNPPCSPCSLEICNVSGHPCMSGITVAEVMSAVKNHLGAA